MKRNDEGGIDLDRAEANAVARVLIAEQLNHRPPEWEDVPNLSESSFVAVADEIQAIARRQAAGAGRWLTYPVTELMEQLR